MTLKDSCPVFPELLEDDYSGSHNSDISPMRIPQDFFSISPASPIYRISRLKNDWDGEGAEKFNRSVIRKAEKFWNLLNDASLHISIPQIDPTSAGSITFTWTDELPGKRLDIWFRGDCRPCEIEWEIESQGRSVRSGRELRPENLIAVVRDYLQG